MANTYSHNLIRKRRESYKGNSRGWYFTTSEGAKAQKELDEMNRQLMDGWKEDRRHSAAHRHSAIKTNKRCARKNKHSDNRKEMKFALNESN